MPTDRPGTPAAGGRPAPPGPDARPDPALISRARRAVLTFAALVLATFVLDTLDLPWRMAALGTGLAALVLAGVALRATWRARMRGFTTVALGAGAVATALAVLGLALVPFVWQIEMERQECRAGAITVGASRSCERAYTDALQEWLAGLEQRLGP